MAEKKLKFKKEAVAALIASAKEVDEEALVDPTQEAITGTLSGLLAWGSTQTPGGEDYILRSYKEFFVGTVLPFLRLAVEKSPHRNPLDAFRLPRSTQIELGKELLKNPVVKEALTSAGRTITDPVGFGQRIARQVVYPLLLTHIEYAAKNNPLLTEEQRKVAEEINNMMTWVEKPTSIELFGRNFCVAFTTMIENEFEFDADGELTTMEYPPLKLLGIIREKAGKALTKKTKGKL